MLEPVANKWKGGMEVQSTPDMVSLVEELNDGDLELEDIDLQEVDRALDEKDKMINGEVETGQDRQNSQRLTHWSDLMTHTLLEE